MSENARASAWRRILRVSGKTIAAYRLIRENDHILVGVSGGKDSWTLLCVLKHFQTVAPISFHIHPVTVHPGFDGFDVESIRAGARRLGFDLMIHRTRIATLMMEKNTPGKNPCALCARMRRGALYRIARENGWNKVALGHHISDAMETLFLSAFFEGRFVSMPPGLTVSGGTLALIRPLIQVNELDIQRNFQGLNLPEVSCPHEKNAPKSRRADIRNLLDHIQKTFPGALDNLAASLRRIEPEHFLDERWLSFPEES